MWHILQKSPIGKALSSNLIAARYSGSALGLSLNFWQTVPAGQVPSGQVPPGQDRAHRRGEILQDLTSQPTAFQRAATVGLWLGWMGLIFWFSTQGWGGHETQSTLNRLLTQYLPAVRAQLSSTDLDTLNFLIRKLAHFTEYAILTVIGYWTWVKALNQPPLLAVRYALIVSVLFAISDEFHQAFEPGRTSLLTDVLIDGLGASAAALLIKSVLRPQLS